VCSYTGTWQRLDVLSRSLGDKSWLDGEAGIPAGALYENEGF